jgi:hypothetical protein
LLLIPLHDSTLRQVQDSVRRAWSEQTIRDTVAAIAKQTMYHRQLTQSLWDRGLRWFGDQIARFFRYMQGVPYGREITITLLVLVVALIVIRLMLGLRDERLARSGQSRVAVRKGNAVTLAEAERLASSGDYTGAAHALFLALISASASRGEVRLHSSKTTGDYARELRRKNVSWLRAFQSFRSRYDRVIYGDMICSADDYRALERDAKPAIAGDRAA